MREDATANSRVIDIIPPNTEGVIYLGEVQGQWIFVQYDRAKGWVERRFVMPLASRGGRISEHFGDRLGIVLNAHDLGVN
jgi:hypothetical protein